MSPRPFPAKRSIFLFTTAWAKDEPPSPTDSHHALPSPGGSRTQSETRRSDVASHDDSSGGPSDIGEHRWFPFTRRRSTLSGTPRLEEKPAALTTSPSGLPDGGICSPIPELKSPEQSRSRARDWGLRIALPSPPATPHALTRSRTPGWDSPWVPRPLESLSHRNIYEQLQNGGSVEEQQPGGSVAEDCRWLRARKRARAYLLTNTYVPLVMCIPRRRPAYAAHNALAFPLCQYHVHYGGSRHCHSNTSNRGAKRRNWYSGKLAVRRRV